MLRFMLLPICPLTRFPTTWGSCPPTLLRAPRINPSHESIMTILSFPTCPAEGHGMEVFDYGALWRRQRRSRRCRSRVEVDVHAYP
ncbi:hypothetical protein IW262DRAFT_1419789 [Armillaria fumosa]|nr:hypothetical protein IW262DRAFT_1419789 [Armillaria fumosa]